jgi:hypothetical protein
VEKIGHEEEEQYITQNSMIAIEVSSSPSLTLPIKRTRFFDLFNLDWNEMKGFFSSSSLVSKNCEFCQASSLANLFRHL